MSRTHLDAAVSTILLDLGGVLTTDPWQSILLTPDTGVADLLGLDRAEVAEAAESLWPSHSLAATEEADYWEQLSGLLGHRIEAAAVASAERSGLRVNPEAAQVLTLLDGRNWGVISDNTAFWYPKQLALLRLDRAPAGYLSFDRGLSKLSAGQGLFELAAGELDAGSTLVVDDRAANIERARRAGFLTQPYAWAAAPSGRSSRATMVNTAKRRPIRATASATRSGSPGSSGSGWRVSTRQNPQARVHREPASMKVAVPSAQHS